MAEEQGDAALVLTHSFLSYRMLKEVLETSNISDDEEVSGSLVSMRWPSC